MSGWLTASRGSLMIVLHRPKCPACGGLPRAASFAVISPWVRELTACDRRTGLIAQCESCGSAWCKYGYTDREMSGLYGDYRGINYLRVRSRWESWYSEHWNSAASDDESIANRRRASLARFLSKYLDPASIESVLDVGGDRGQFIPFGSRRMVLDVSDRQLAPGVQRVSQVDDLNHWDLVISAHLLGSPDVTVG